MQAALEWFVEGAGEVLFRGIRASLCERLVGAPLASILQDPGPVEPVWSFKQSAPLGAEGATCPPPPVAAACPAVCLGLAVDLSGGVSPWLLSSVVALLWVTAICAACAGCCCGLLSPTRWWRRLPRPFAGEPAAALPQDPRAPSGAQSRQASPTALARARGYRAAQPRAAGDLRASGARERARSAGVPVAAFEQRLG